jgi:hypothetical protein
MGQAGRKIPASKPAPPKSEPAPSPTPEPRKPRKPKFTLRIVQDVSQTLYTSFPFPERLETWTINRLKKSPLLEVSLGDHANRAQAVRLAKAETEAYIIWLQLEEDNLEPDRTGHRAALQDRINFEILAPETGKQKYAGTIFITQTSRGIGLGRIELVCYPGVRGDDYLLLQASLEVAARIMDYLDVPVPPACP